MKLNEYIKVNAERMSGMSESQSIVKILSGNQELSVPRAHELREAIEVAADSFDDETIQEYPELCKAWESGQAYTAGTRVNYGGTVYTVLQEHTSQSDWTPTDAPSLFAQVLTNADGTPAEWVQPDSTNPYMAGDKVIYNGKIYESLIDNNVWSPDAYPAGWKVVE